MSQFGRGTSFLEVLFARYHAFFVWLTVVVVALASLTPVFMSQKVSADQLTNRSVTITTSVPSATNVQYTYGFTTATSAAIQSIKFQVCTTPLGSCTSPGGTTNVNAGNQVGTVGGSWTNTTGFTRNASGANDCTAAANVLCISRTQAAAESTADKTITWDTQTNPTAVASYYVRITLYSTTNWTVGDITDTGVVAFAIVNQLTVIARVQENLQFCVGTTSVNDATTSAGADCSAISGTNIDIGAIDTAISTSPVATNPNGGNNLNGIAMVRTNASNGTTVSYFAQQNTGSGKLKVLGATCSGTSTTDQCFNSQGATQGTFVGGTENFGMTIGGVNCGSTTAYTCAFASGTNNLKQATNYVGNTSTAYGVTSGFAWVDTGATTTIASTTGSTKVLDDEALILRFAATAAATTPTGSYSVVSTYIATPTF